ncbi:MAG: VWA domain-containing protein [Planctomycetes bacterium]|nr:VWA domain-containing protein [Planctomycetota bacterium]
MPLSNAYVSRRFLVGALTLAVAAGHLVDGLTAAPPPADETAPQVSPTRPTHSTESAQSPPRLRQADAADRDFKLVKKEFLRKARSQRTKDRLTAITLLADFPTIEAAELMQQQLLGDSDTAVREAAIQWLATLRDDTDIADKLLQKLTLVTRKSGLGPRELALLRSLGGTEGPELQMRLVKFLNEFLGTARVDQHLLHDTLDDLADHHADAELLRLLLVFCRTEFFERHFGFRRCVVQALIAIPDPDAVTRLIHLLPHLDGQVQFDVVAHLMATTGQDFGSDAGKWLLWWNQNQTASRKADRNVSRVPGVSRYGQHADYHGIPMGAKRIVFVLDTSLSMQGGKIERAQTELLRAIDQLPPAVAFSIVFFDGTVRVWQRDLVPANEQMKRIAKLMVRDQSLGANTASYDALEAAFALDPEAIYFLSDGEPVGGQINNPAEIVATFAALNRVRRVSIHTIGVDTNLPGTEIFARFMKTLAQANWGIYQAVN